MDVNAKLKERAKLLSDARAILDKVEAEKRDITAEESAQWDKLHDEARKIKVAVERHEQQESLERDLDNVRETALRPDVDGAPEKADGNRAAEAYSRWLRTGNVTAEIRALQSDKDESGGFLLPPEQWVDGLIKAVDNQVFMRGLATVYSVPTAESLGVPSLDNDPADPAWTSELAIGTEDSTMSFGKRSLHPHPLAKYIKVSRELLRRMPGVEGLVRDRLAYKFAVTLEDVYLEGSGSGQPLGVFTASSDGINTDRDVSTGNTATSIKTDGLLEAKYTLKQQYRARARWIFHRDAVKQIAKLKDGAGNYLWQPSVVLGQPDTLLNLPVIESEYAPSTFSASQYVGIIGDFTHYWIADAHDLEMQRLDELYAASNQVGFIGRFNTDGMPVLSEAFARVKLAAS